MNGKVYINSDQVNVVMQNINSIQKRLNDAIEKQKQLKEQMHKAWGGTTGDKAYEKLVKYEKKYDVYIRMLNKRIKFLEEVINSYQGWDDSINKKIDENFSRKK